MRLLTFIVLPYTVFGQLNYTDNFAEENRIQRIVDLIGANLERNRWTNILCVGGLKEIFYNELKRIPFSVVVMNAEHEDDEVSIEGVTPYYSNTIIVSFLDLQDFKRCVVKITQSPYWHPHSNIYLYHHSKTDKLLIAKLFFILSYYQACNVVHIHYDDTGEKMYVSNYSPYINNEVELENNVGCWTTAKHYKFRNETLEESFTCVENCHNVSLHSELRASNLGTCIGLNVVKVLYNDHETAISLNLFEDKGRNLHGFALRAYTTETLPFLRIEEHKNQTYTLHGRDGFIWNSISDLMNFTIDLSPSAYTIKDPYNFKVSIQQMLSLAHRSVDLYLVPLYLFDTSKILEIDYTIPFEQSGVCIVSHRAEFEIIIFDAYFLFKSYKFLVELTLCNLSIWFLFILFRFVDKRRLTYDQIGKDMMNTIRTLLLISLHNPPKQQSFRIFMLISMWSFFLISFASHAAIVSFFTVVKRGKDIEKIDDIIAKDYTIEGMLSPDIMLLEDDDERLRQIHSKLVPTQDYFECVRRMSNDSHRFCLIDCSLSRYMQENTLNNKGEQYIRIAKDKIHSYYLSLILPKHSPMTAQVNKYMRRFLEAGLLTKWNEYKYNAMKNETPLKPLGLENFKSIFKGYCILLGITVLTFLIEVIGVRVSQLKK